MIVKLLIIICKKQYGWWLIHYLVVVWVHLYSKRLFKISIFHSSWNFKMRQISGMIFFVAIDPDNKKYFM